MIREAVTSPSSIRLPGYQPVMPSYQGQMSEDQLLQLVAYVKSLTTPERNGQ
jgi:cytochrome c oxidase subunit 2